MMTISDQPVARNGSLPAPIADPDQITGFASDDTIDSAASSTNENTRLDVLG